MKNLFIVLLLLAVSNVSAQKFFTKTGHTEFKASVETFEPVEATNNSTTAVLNADNGEVAVLLFVKAFHFKVALMEEHFNENYMDSAEFPKATFKGKIADFDFPKLDMENQEYKTTGVLTIKGVSKSVETIAKIRLADDKILAASEFSVQPEDFGIKIPGIVRNKVAEKVNITFEYELVEKN